METEFLYVAQYKDGNFEGVLGEVDSVKDALKISDVGGFEEYMKLRGKSDYEFKKVKCSYEFV